LILRCLWRCRRRCLRRARAATARQAQLLGQQIAELENVQVMLMKQKLDVSKRQLLKEPGYHDALIEQMLAEGSDSADSATTHVVMNGSGGPLSLPVGDGRIGVP
jgi:hypothetical protein